jgi:hypothetical protein
MAKRHRQRVKKQVAGRPLTATGAVSLVAESPAASRPGLDATVIMTLQDLDRLVGDMRKEIPVPSGAWDEDTAVKRYLVYLSMLVDILLAEIVMSAIHSSDMMVFMKQRMLVEYAAKAAYYDDNPEYALFMMTIDKADQRLRKLVDADSDPSLVAGAKTYRDDMLRQFSAVSSLKRMPFAAIMTNYADKDDYVWLYGVPSALMHGDPEGIEVLIEVRSDGSQVPTLTLPVERVNAMLVDAGTNTLMFCERFIGRFHANEQGLVARLKDLRRRFLGLVLKHPYGRDADALESVKNELADFT